MKHFHLLIFVCLLTINYSCNKTDYYNVSTYSEGNNVNVVIEIPAGTNKKYELNLETNTFEIDKKNGVDRVINFLPYVGNYGFIPSTYSNPNEGGDGDALDVLVLSESLNTGTIVEVIPIAILKLIDDGEIDYKIIATPAAKNLQIINANSYQDLKDNYSSLIKIIELWFLNYDKSDTAFIQGWGTKEQALKEIFSNKK